jgi:uncharacterized membrane protein YbhN (UPF0104 family)
VNGDAPRGAGTSRRITALRWGLVAAGIIFFVQLIRGADLDRAWMQLRHLGWPVVLVLLPTLAAMMLDARGWQAILGTLGHRVAWRRLLRMRVSVEAIVLALPGGSVAGEAAKMALLRRMDVPLPVGAASLALTKLMLVASDTAYLALAGLWLSIAIASGAHASWIPVLLCFAGVAVTGTATIGLALVLRRSTAATKVALRLSASPIRFLARWFERRRAQAADLDAATRSHFAAPGRDRVGAFIPFALEWLCEGIETLIILYCLGVPIGIGPALAVDGLGSLLRALVFFVPAGLGIQDAAQVMLLASLGVSDPLATGTAFIVVKRTKEIFWIAIGLLLFAGNKGAWLRTATGSPTTMALPRREGDATC